jgi:hypothetical protein
MSSTHDTRLMVLVTTRPPRRLAIASSPPPHSDCPIETPAKKPVAMQHQGHHSGIVLGFIIGSRAFVSAATFDGALACSGDSGPSFDRGVVGAAE